MLSDRVDDLLGPLLLHQRQGREIPPSSVHQGENLVLEEQLGSSAHIRMNCPKKIPDFLGILLCDLAIYSLHLPDSLLLHLLKWLWCKQHQLTISGGYGGDIHGGGNVE